MNTINKNRRNNLDYLVDYQYGSQSNLAFNLNYHGLGQATLSDILRFKRTFYGFEVKAVEEKLGIPDSWMDKKDWVKNGWTLIEQYQKMDEVGKALFNETIKFVLNPQCQPKN